MVPAIEIKYDFKAKKIWFQSILQNLCSQMINFLQNCYNLPPRESLYNCSIDTYFSHPTLYFCFQAKFLFSVTTIINILDKISIRLTPVILCSSPIFLNIDNFHLLFKIFLLIFIIFSWRYIIFSHIIVSKEGELKRFQILYFIFLVANSYSSNSSSWSVCLLVGWLVHLSPVVTTFYGWPGWGLRLQIKY